MGSAYCSVFSLPLSFPQSPLSSDTSPAPACLLHYNNTPAVRPFFPLPDGSIPSASNSSGKKVYGLRDFPYCFPALRLYVAAAVLPLSSWTGCIPLLPPPWHASSIWASPFSVFPPALGNHSLSDSGSFCGTPPARVSALSCSNAAPALSGISPDEIHPVHT